MKKIFCLISFFIVNSFALDINKAIELSLTNNNLIKESQSKKEESSEILNSSKSVYKPKLDLVYKYDNKFQRKIGVNKNDSSLNLNLTYNIFNGFADENSINSSKNNLKIAKHNFNSVRHDIILKTKQNFISYLKARKNTNVQETTLKLFQKQYADAKNFYKNGVQVTLNNLLEVEISLLGAKKSLEEAKSAQRISEEKLFNTIGIVVSGEIKEIPSHKNNYLNYSNYKIKENYKIKSLKEYKKSLSNQKEILKSKYYPKLDASLQHKRYGDSLELNNINGTAKPQNVALLTLSWNLYNGNTDQSSILAYGHKIRQVDYQINEIEKSLNLNYTQAQEKLKLSIETLKISKKTLEQAKVNYEIVNNSFQEGIVTSKDLVDANYLRTKAEGSYYDAYYNNLLAIAQIQRLEEKEEKEYQ